MIDQKYIEALMNLYFFLIGLLGFYFLFREIFYLRKEAQKRERNLRKMKGD